MKQKSKAKAEFKNTKACVGSFKRHSLTTWVAAGWIQQVDMVNQAWISLQFCLLLGYFLLSLLLTLSSLPLPHLFADISSRDQHRLPSLRRTKGFTSSQPRQAPSFLALGH